MDLEELKLNEETLQALVETLEIENNECIKSFKSMDELLDELDS